MSREQGGGAPTWISFMRRGSISAPICAISAIWRATGIGLPETGCRMADLAAAAHLSCVDFLGDVPWEENETAKSWYAG